MMKQEKYKSNFKKIKWLELDIAKNNIIFIPPYWWYTFQYTSDTEILTFKYRTFMNNIAILPELIINLLQNNNTKLKVFENLAEVSDQNIKDNVPPEKSNKKTI